MTVLLDTNVLLDFILKRAPFFDDSRIILIAIANKSINAVISAQAISDMFYILRKTYTNKERRDILLWLTELIDIIGIDKNMVITALKDDTFPDFEDYIQTLCAEKVDAKLIISRNIKDFQNSNIKCISPRDLILYYLSEDQKS